jgi:beta-lactamase regulating signal transducer with metallopeptidase domain
MSVLWDAIEFWPIRAILVGGGILLAGRLLMGAFGQPSRRAFIGTAAVVAALLVIPVSLLPGWLPLTVETATPNQVSAAAPTDMPRALSGPADEGEELDILPDPDPAAERAHVDKPLTANELASAINPGRAEIAAGTESTVDWRSIIFVAYGFMVALLLGRLVVGQLALERLWRKAVPAPAWAEGLFSELARRTSPRAQLRISRPAAGPVCFGVWRPRVVVPAEFLATGDRLALKAILTHELAHLVRRDPLTGWLFGLARAVYFVWPWLAGLRREVRLAQEHLADADAARTAGPTDYAEMLIGMTRARPAPLGAAGVRGPSSELYRRVTMILRTSGRVEQRCPRRWALALGGGLTALAAAAAGLYLEPRPAVAAEPAKKEPDKPATKPDPLAEALEKIKKDLGDNPEAVKQLELLLKMLKEGMPAGVDAFPVPVPRVDGQPPRPVLRPRPVPAPPAVDPGGPPGPRVRPIEPPDLDKEIEQAQEMLRKQLEQMAIQLGGRGVRGGGLMLGPDGVLRPIGPSGGRLGIRVEKPSDVLTSQLDLPAGQGLVCIDVPADSPAGRAGIKPNDILLEVAGKPVPNSRDEFVKGLSDVKPDTPVDVVLLRKGKKETVKGLKLPEPKEFGDLPGFPRGVIPDFPALPQLRPAPGAVPGPFDDGGFPGAARKPGVVVGPGETARVEQVNDAFTVFYTKDGVKVTISGSKDVDGVAKAESIEIEANGKTTKAESIDKLPKEYQDLARSAMKAVK